MAARTGVAMTGRLKQAALRAGVPPRSTWQATIPAADRLVEAAWRSRIRRAPVLSGAAHAALVDDPARRARDIEEVIGCSLCGETRMHELAHPRDRTQSPPWWDYHVVRCVSCGFLYRHPGVRADRVGDLYAADGAPGYSSFLGGDYGRHRQRRYRLTMDGFGALLADGTGRRLLDFGCGIGLFLDVAHGRGFSCSGVDLTPDAVDVARRKPSGRDAHVGAPQDVPTIAPGGFDVITMWSVLAHLATPVEDLTRLRGLLADDGVLVLLTVNANSLDLKRHGAAWVGFTPNHLKFFAPDTLALLLRTAGFGAVVMPPWHGDDVEEGTSSLRPAAQWQLRRAVGRGNRGNMLRAAAFVDPEGPARWGLSGRRL